MCGSAGQFNSASLCILVTFIIKFFIFCAHLTFKMKNASRESTVCYFYTTGARASPAHSQRQRTLNLHIQMPTRFRCDGFNNVLTTTHISKRNLRHGPTYQGLDFGFQGLMFRFGDLVLRYAFPSRKDTLQPLFSESTRKRKTATSFCYI